MSPDVLTRLTTALGDRYRLERELGAGGMATVYLAQDLRHDRRVALKLLRPELAAVIGAERFLAEIKVTANLQHPHILPLFDSGEADGLLFYVMPYVEGESLRTRLLREKQLAVDEAVRLTTEVASALDYAHRHGVVHRDIKPENVLLHDGTALVADFGIALAASQAGATRMTATGMSLGTPAYMSPEQAMGDREVDARSDIYALGAMLYEMLVGDPPYVASTAQAIVAKVLTEKPVPVTVHRDTVPSNVAAAVQKALAKLPADRFGSAAEFVRALTTANWSSGDLLATRPLTAGVARTSRRRVGWPAMAVLCAASGAIVGALGASRLRPASTAGRRPVIRFALDLPKDAQVVGRPGSTIAFAPDGASIVYVGGTPSEYRLYTRYMDRSQPVPIPGTEQADMPFFSADGRWLAFIQQGKVVRTPIAGGPITTICSAPANMFSAAWLPSDTLVIAADSGLLEVAASGGTPRVVARPAPGEQFLAPFALPGGAAVVFTIRETEDSARKASQQLKLAIYDHRTATVTRLAQTGGYPRWVDGGWLVVTDPAGLLLAVPFDAERRVPSGPAVPIFDGATVAPNGDLNLGVSRNGAIAYQPNANQAAAVVMVDRQGIVRDTFTSSGAFYSPRLSADGRRIAMMRGREPQIDFDVRDIWVYDRVQRTLTRATFDSLAMPAVWSHDGGRLAVSHFLRGTGDMSIRIVTSDGSAAPRQLALPKGQWYPDQFEPRDRALLYHGRTPNAPLQIWRLPLEDGAKPDPVLSMGGAEVSAPSLSPDAKWMAYVSNESGHREVYVRPYRSPGGRSQVSLDGGTEPIWSGTGREIFYRAGDRVMSASVRTTPSFEVLSRTQLFAGDFSSGVFGDRTWDATADGQRFLFTHPVHGGQQAVIMTLNWFDQRQATP